MLVAFAVLFTGCGRAPRETARPEPGAPASVIAAPVLAPMVARERLLEDLGQQQQQARERAAVFDDAAGRDR